MDPIRRLRSPGVWASIMAALATLHASQVAAQGSAPGSVSASSRSFYLVSLENASPAEAADAVLVQSLRTPVTVDPGLTGRITFRVSESLSEAGFEERFAAALAEQNIALVRTEEGYRLMDLVAALAVRPRLDLVTIQPPPMKSGALTVPPNAGKTEPTVEPDEGRSLGWLIATGLGLGLVSLVWLAWISRSRRWALLGKLSSDRSQVGLRHPSRAAVIDLLMSKVSIELPVLATACDEAARQGRPVEQVLCDLKAIDEAQLAAAYAEVTGLSRWDETAMPYAPSPELVQMDALLRGRPLKVVQADEWSITVATADPLDDGVFASVSRLSGRMVTLVVAPRSALPAPDVIYPVGDRAIVIPWFKPAASDGAALLQAILSRRLSSKAPD